MEPFAVGAVASDASPVRRRRRKGPATAGTSAPFGGAAERNTEPAWLASSVCNLSFTTRVYRAHSDAKSREVTLGCPLMSQLSAGLTFTTSG